ncbi:hypothetical protein HWI79_1804 [Cryptosporidium felis]|nr:hypothetical protein HWI79_1804 [Cryptosporidium felis]
MNENEIIGIILAIKWPYQEPEIIFYYPPSSFTILMEKCPIKKVKNCFGLLCSKLAPLILPSDPQLWNKTSDLVIESKEFQHRFIFFPISTARSPNLSNTILDSKKDCNSSSKCIKLKKHIESFSITLVFDASVDLNSEFIYEKLNAIVNSFAIDEVADGFVSREILQISEFSLEDIENAHKRYIDSTNSAADDFDSEITDNSYLQINYSQIIEERSRMVKKLIKFYSNLKNDYSDLKYCSKNTHNCSCEIKIANEDKYIKENLDKLTVIVKNDKLSITSNENELLNEFIKIVDPHMSILDISKELLESPSNILDLCNSLIIKNAAKITEIVTYDKIYVIVPEIIKIKMNNFNTEFNCIIDWRGCNPLTTISSFFCKGMRLNEIKDEINEFFRINTKCNSESEPKIYCPYESRNIIQYPTNDHALNSTKLVISWLVVNGCIEALCSICAL